MCPAYRVDGWESVSPRGKLKLAESIGKIDARLLEDIYKCSLCGLCEVVCPEKLELVEFWENLRTKLVEAGKTLPAHRKLAEIVSLYGNPYGEDQKTRASWLGRELGNAKTLYFAGCMASFKLQRIAKSTASILEKLGIEFRVAGGEEYCCGSPFLRTGYRKVAEKLFEKNVRVWQKMGIERIVTSCPGCYRTIALDYAEMAEAKGIELDIEVIHVTAILDSELSSGDRRDILTTFHDPCHLGRHMGVYEEPRSVIRKLGLELVEMERNRELALCCGAGGGLRTQFKEISRAISRERIKEAEATGAELLLTSCPFCVYQLSRSAEKMGSKIKVADIVEVADRIVSP